MKGAPRISLEKSPALHIDDRFCLDDRANIFQDGYPNKDRFPLRRFLRLLLYGL